jgi:hypothetical protein
LVELAGSTEDHPVATSKWWTPASTPLGGTSTDLALIDADGFPAYLESSNPANNHRYAGVGFEEVGEFSYPGGDPVVTTMWRPAR